MCSTRLNFHFNMLKKSVLVFLLLTLTACGGGGGGDGGSNANVKEGKEINPYLVPDKNSTFYYNNESSGVKFLDPIVADNSLLDVLVYPTGGKEYYFTDKEQIALKGFYSPYIPISNVGNFSADFMFNDKLVLWKEGSAIGSSQKINTSGSSYISPKYGRRTVSFEGTSTYHGVRPVTLTYGTFEAIGVSYEISAHLTVDENTFYIQRHGEMLLVEGIGIVARSENGVPFFLTNYEGKDSDADGVFDIFDKFPNDADEHIDTDSDGIGNNEDTDDDGDGIDDLNDGFPLIPAAPDDSDGDSYSDITDAFPHDENEHLDTDSDGIGNNKDTDDDNDGINDLNDKFPATMDDADNDGLSAELDPDDDNDGYNDIIDAFPHDENEYLDTDKDGIGNNEDTDDDNDGRADINDKFPLDSTAKDDFDNDGIDDIKDTDDDNDGYLDENDYYPYDSMHYEPLSVSSTDFTSTSVLGDSESEIMHHTLEVSGAYIGWELNSSVDWLTLSQNESLGRPSYITQEITLTVNAKGLSLGLNAAQLTLTNKLDGSKQVMTVTVNRILPVISLSVDSIELDGSFSWKNLSNSLTLSLNTGSNSYGITYQINVFNEGLISVDTAEHAGGEPSYVDIKFVDISKFIKDITHGEVIFTADVLGEKVTATLDVNILASKHMILVPDSGVALSKFVTAEKLSHTIDILDSYGLTSTTWNATTTASWLTVTATGTTADRLTMTADVTDLETDTLHRAIININSSDAGIENSQTINVGLWVGSTDPKSRASIAVEYSNIASDPVRPYVYLTGGGSDIDVYNVYDQTLVTTITEVGTALGKMEASANGKYLYVADSSNDSVIVIDLDNVSNRNHWQSTDSLAEGFTLSKTNNQELLISGYGNIYNAQTGKLYVSKAHTYNHPSYTEYNYLDASLFGNRFCGVNSGLYHYEVICYDLSYSTVREKVTVSDVNGRFMHGIGGGGGGGRDIALNNEGAIAYTASREYYAFITINIDTMTAGVLLSAEAYPTAVEVGSDNALHGSSGAGGWWDSNVSNSGVWVYESTGTLRHSDYVSNNGDVIKNQALVISGDGLISIALTSNPSVAFVSGF